MRISIPVTLIAASLVISPVPALAQCNTDCAVGDFGTGGANSDGNAQGFFLRGDEYFNAGNQDAGKIFLWDDDELIGELSGTYREGDCIGRATGIFGDYTGISPDC